MLGSIYIGVKQPQNIDTQYFPRRIPKVQQYWMYFIYFTAGVGES